MQRPVRLQGLDPNKKYQVKEINLYDNQNTPVDENKRYSGDFLMKAGFNPYVNSARSSVVLLIKAV